MHFSSPFFTFLPSPHWVIVAVLPLCDATMPPGVFVFHLTQGACCFSIPTYFVPTVPFCAYSILLPTPVHATRRALLLFYSVPHLLHMEVLYSDYSTSALFFHTFVVVSIMLILFSEFSSFTLWRKMYHYYYVCFWNVPLHIITYPYGRTILDIIILPL